jgi:protein-S-isoprenylcysteine O-methyltransferase Ste14
MSIDRWFYRFRAYLVSPPLFFAVFCSYQETETFVWPLGISVFILGFALRLWAQQHLHYRLRVHKHLSTTGPYGFVRQCSYRSGCHSHFRASLARSHHVLLVFNSLQICSPLRRNSSSGEIWATLPRIYVTSASLVSSKFQFFKARVGK